MFKCWKCSSSDPMLVGFIIFIALFWSLMRGWTTGLLADMTFTLYKSQVHMLWCHAVMSLQFTCVRPFACRGRLENCPADCSTIGLYCVRITWQQMFTSGYGCRQGCRFGFFDYYRFGFFNAFGIFLKSKKTRQNYSFFFVRRAWFWQNIVWSVYLLQISSVERLWTCRMQRIFQGLCCCPKIDRCI